MKVTDKHFIDWESETFGFGYGTGEQYTLQALKDFMSVLQGDRNYNHEDVERKLGKTVAWLLINILCKADMLDYGTSPRFGWLSEEGELLWDFMKDKSVDELYDLVGVDQEYVHCYKDHCNCLESCNNPLW